MNLSDIYYLKLNLSLLSFNIDTSLNIESKEGIIDNNYTKEKLNNLIQKINILTFNKSNSSIMCQILYFLLMSYDLSYSNTLRLCYPVITLNDLKIFKETIYNIISNILPKIILCGKSLLDEACGKKLEKFLRNFSDYIISYKISKEINKKNIIYEQLLEYKNNNENNNILLNIKKNCIIIQISNLREIIISKLKNINNIQNKWKINALNISKQLEKENEKNIKLKNKYNLIISGNKSRFSEICSLDRSTKIENHTNFIETINGLHQKFIKNEEFKNNIEYINNKENKDIIDSINSNIILNNNNNIIIKNSIDISKDKKELELLIKELKEKNDKNCELLFVLHEQINNLEQRLKEDNLKFIERNFKKIDNNNNNKEFESKTKKFGIALDEQIEKLKNIEIILNKLKNELV
jgi:hypothetical protein